MKAVVTGGCGFIGRHVVKELLSKNYEVVAIDVFLDEELKEQLPKVKFYKIDISNPGSELDEAMKGSNVVFHFAGLLGTSELFSRIIEAEIVNVVGTLKLLESMKKHNVKKIVFTSKPNIWKHNVYTITKENSEKYLHMYHEIFGIEPVILCPFNVYGPEEKLEQYRKAVPYFIISAVKGEPLEIFGSGKQTMDLVFVEDMAKAAVLLSENPNAVGKRVEIGSGKETSVLGFAQKVIEVTKSNSKIVHLQMRKGEVPETHLCADIKLLKSITGYVPDTTLEKGIEKTLEHYKNHLDKYKKIYQFKKEDML